jgi:hypothetical protein
LNNNNNNKRGLIRANQAPKYDQSEEKLPSKLRECLEINARLNEKKKKLIEEKKAKQNGLLNGIQKTSNAAPKGKKQLERIAYNYIMSSKPDDKGAEVPLRKTPKLEQNDRESEQGFMNRMNRVNFTFNDLIINTS